ncbi:MAG: plastocyanin/azurin family copper-binding protein [Nitrosopumilaceae archaeon]
MTSVDKAAIGWSIAIVAVGVAIAFAGGPGISIDSGAPATTAPVMQEKTTMSQAEEREEAIAEQMTGKVEEKVSVTPPRVEEAPKMAGPTTVEVSMPTGTAVPGCEETDACYIPSSVSISTGSTVVWINDDTAAHTVTSGSPTDGPDGIFDSSLVLGGDSFEVTFDDSGNYDYFCLVHPWMKGTVNVS